jgi:peptide deformylase
MSLLPLSYYPESILLKPSDPVTEFDDKLRRLVERMFLTMYAAPGVGLAAPQIGISKRLFVMDCTPRGERPRTLVVANPEIIATEGGQNDYEGCLSLPGYEGKVTRPMSLVVRGQTADGSDLEYTATGLEARCIAHETDHCDGILYIRHLGPQKREEIIRSIKKKKRDGEWPPSMNRERSFAFA